MQIKLPDGATAELLANDEITERVFRPIDRAKTKIINVSVGLIERGYDPPATWPETLKCVTYALDENGKIIDQPIAIWPEGVSTEEAASREAEITSRNLKNAGIETGLSDEDHDRMDNYQMALILGITKSWSYEVPITEESVLDLKKTVIEFLASECGKVFDNTEVDLSPNPNPKAPASDSGV